MIAHFLITWSDFPLNGNEGEIHQTDEYFYVKRDIKTDALKARLKEIMDLKFPYWKSEYFFGIIKYDL